MSDSTFKMADVADKAITRRRAVAGGRIEVGRDAYALLESNELPKGDALSLAEFAGLQGAKQTPALLPLCHPLSLNRVMVRTSLNPEHYAVDVFCLAEIAERTGVEMEALTGVSIALLTVWDLVKPVNPNLEISRVRLLYKSGGKSGTWKHPEGLPPAVHEMLHEP